MRTVLIFLLLFATFAQASWVVCDQANIGVKQVVGDKEFTCVKDDNYHWSEASASTTSTTTTAQATTTTIIKTGTASDFAKDLMARVFAMIDSTLRKRC